MLKILLFLFCMIFTLILSAMGILSFRKKTPAQFWTHTSLRSEELKNVISYNRTVGIMWCIYAVPFLAAAILAVAGKIFWSAVFLTVSCFPGSFLLMFAYMYILKSNTKKDEKVNCADKQINIAEKISQDADKVSDADNSEKTKECSSDVKM